MATVYEFKPRTQTMKRTQTVKRTVKIRWKRLFLSLTILTVLMYGVVHLVSDVFQVAKNFVQEQQEKSFQRSLKKYEQVEIIVDEGDTAWEIQKRLTPNDDVRIPLYLAEKLNPGVKMGELHPGQKIIMLKSKE